MVPTIATKSCVFRFADVTVREREFTVIEGGRVQQVEPKAFRLLLVLLRNPNKLIAKEELLSSVWADTAVTENSLARNIALLRRLLTDDPREPRYIETVSGIGYRFICPVEVTEEFAEDLSGTRGAEPARPNGNESGRVSASLLAQDSVEVAGRTTHAIAAAPHLTGRWAVGAGAVFICLALLLWLYASRQSHSLTDKDSVVLADFVNTTGDAVFDGTLRQGLTVQLAQSPFLNLVSDQQIQHTMSLMGQPPDERLSSSTALQLCQRIAASAVVEGTIARLGTEYVVGLRAVRCRTGDALAEQQVQAARKEDVLKALSRASAQLRKKLGESLSTLEKFDTPLDEATTPSLDALFAYTMGRKELVWHGNVPLAVPLFQRAIDLDPNFAMAYLSLGLCETYLGQPSLATENIRRAYELREHVSEWEKFAIESRYDFGVVGNLPKARDVYRLWAQIYPHESIPLAVLGQDIDPELGRYDDALADTREALSRSPQNPENYEGLVVAYMTLNQLDSARATADEATVKKLVAMDLPQHLYHLAFLRADTGGMALETAWAVGKPGVDALLLSYQADTAAYNGQIEKARELSRRAIASATLAGQNETAAGYQSELAIREGLFGDFAEARRQAEDALALSSARDVQARAAFALALARGPAEQLAEDLARRFPEDTVAQSIFQPVIHAQLALNNRDPVQAIRELEAAAPFELASASPEQAIPFALYPCYLRGNAFLALKRGMEAAVEFQKILDHPGVVINEPIGVLAHRGLGRAYALIGQRDKAQASYRKFLTLWHEADTGNPIFREASLEYRQLNDAK